MIFAPRRSVDEDLDVLQTAGGALIGTRQIVGGGDGLRGGQVDDEQMRQGCAGDGLPDDDGHEDGCSQGLNHCCL